MMRLQASPTPDMIKRDTPRPTKQTPDPSTTAGTIWVEFSPETTIGIKHLRAFAQHLDQHKFTTGVFITIGPVTAAALRAFEPLSERGITAEWFQEQDLLVNITRHELVPKHVLLSAEEKKVLLDRYRLKETQLPRIQYSDPVARYLGLRRGNVVKIIRKSETAGRYASYRWVF
jgi:DNA-directed RNA polymerase I, II, and III subunit RPABC1